MTQTYFSLSFSLFSFLLLHNVNWLNASISLLTHSPWLLSHWLIVVDLLVDSYSLTHLTHSDSLLVQVLVVVADLCLYKNPLKPTHSSLPLSLSFTSEYNASCLVYCPLCESPLFSPLPWSTLALETTSKSCKLYYNNLHTQNHLDRSRQAY